MKALRFRHAQKIVVDAINTTFGKPDPSFPCSAAFDKVVSWPSCDNPTSTLTTSESAKLAGYAAHQMVAGNCNAFQAEVGTLWQNILNGTKCYWENNKLYSEITLPFDAAKFSQPTMTCDPDSPNETTVANIIASLSFRWSNAPQEEAK